MKGKKKSRKDQEENITNSIRYWKTSEEPSSKENERLIKTSMLFLMLSAFYFFSVIKCRNYLIHC